jgi:integrase/recombinase XerC
MVSFTTVPEALAAYKHWLARQPLSNHTRRAYLTQVNQYGAYLSALPWEYGHPLQEPHARDYAVRDYKTNLKTVHHAKPTTVNLALAALDHFYRFLELPSPQVKREDLPSQSPVPYSITNRNSFCERSSAARQSGTVRLRYCCSTQVCALVNALRSR